MNEYIKQATEFLQKTHAKMKIEYWDSIRNTEIRTMPFDAYNVQANKELAAKKKAAVPSVYDVLACLQKCDPGTFENFCSDYGYDDDSRTAIRVYLAVQNEYTQLARLFTPEQMEELVEIN